jgi:excisionase family DNA binding protein
MNERQFTSELFQATKAQRPFTSDDSLTKRELASRLNLPSTRMVDQLMRKRKIPFTKLGYRTVRFSWAKVCAALEKLQINAA